MYISTCTLYMVFSLCTHEHTCITGICRIMYMCVHICTCSYKYNTISQSTCRADFYFNRYISISSTCTIEMALYGISYTCLIHKKIKMFILSNKEHIQV